MEVRTDSVKEVISRNTGFAFGRQFLTGVVFLLVTPYAISKLGLERYGVWALISAVLGYASLGDLGVRTAFKKYVAQHYAVGGREYILTVVGDGLIFYSILGTLPTLLTLAFGRQILTAFNVGSELLPEARSLLLLMAVVFLIENVSNVFCGVIEGVQRMDVSNSIFVGQAVLLGAGTVTALSRGDGLVGMGVAAITAAAASAASMFVAAQRVSLLRLLPWRLRVSRAVFRELMGYGIKLQGSGIAMLGNLHLDKLLLARFWGLEIVAVYEIALRLALVFRQAPALTVSALVPAVSDLHARGERALLEKVYEKGVRYVALAGIPLAVIALIYADDLIVAWIGSSAFARSAGVMRLLAAAHCTAIMVDAPFATARGLGVLRYELSTGVVHPLVHLSLGLLLVPAYGLWGAGLAHASVVIAVAAGAAYWTHKGLGLSRKPFLRFYREAVGRPLLAALAAAAVALPVRLLSSAVSGAGAERLDAIVRLCVSGAIFASVYAAVVLRTGSISVGDLTGVPLLGRVLACRLCRRIAREGGARAAPGAEEVGS